MTRVRASRPFEEYHEEQVRDPEFAAAYRALEPEFQVARMVPDVNKGRAVWAAEDDPRATRVGRILRRTHVDEFPPSIPHFPRRTLT